jgi:large subunit ribosomal protein L18
MASTNLEIKLRRKRRNRYKLKKTATNGRLRLSVFRSNLHIYAQLIDDKKRHTVASASTVETTFPEASKTSDIQAATLVGKLIAERALAVGVKEIYFDRGSYLYHGRVKALAESARGNGLVF